MEITDVSGTLEASGSTVELEGCTSEVRKYFSFLGENGKIIEADKSKYTPMCAVSCV